MRLVAPGKILFFVLLFLTAEQIFTQSPSQAAESPNFVSAKISLYEFGRRQSSWLTNHPELATEVVVTRSLLPYNQHDKNVNRNYRLSYPTLDIYSSAGVPLYFSDSSEENVKVIDALPQVIPEPDLNPKYQVRPSLREVLAMVPGILRSDWATPAQIDYTIFVVSFDRTNVSVSQATKKAVLQQNMNASGPKIRAIQEPCAHPEDGQKIALAHQAANQAQEDAVERLKARLNGARIRVIEVRLVQ
ncbi:hypothetical protein [Terracidiphilus gabretensis]|uniref:hypothetical protein n=1 Tax=Terracidiphilus gabretensis TaxID=1577687 RepID=UPI00071B1705|nr:hypothetical protein [Terracidiphilus gabretensis]